MKTCSKSGSGNTQGQVLRKLYLLTLYLRAVNLGQIVQRSIFFWLVSECV